MHDAVHGIGDEKENLFKIGSVLFSRQTMRRLQNNEMLNDDIVNEYLSLLSKSVPEGRGRVFSLNSFFFAKLTEKIPPGKRINFRKVKK